MERYYFLSCKQLTMFVTISLIEMVTVLILLLVYIFVFGRPEGDT
jgi:hypothetical protein